MGDGADRIVVGRCDSTAAKRRIVVREVATIRLCAIGKRQVLRPATMESEIDPEWVLAICIPRLLRQPNGQAYDQSEKEKKDERDGDHQRAAAAAKVPFMGRQNAIKAVRDSPSGYRTSQTKVLFLLRPIFWDVPAWSLAIDSVSALRLFQVALQIGKWCAHGRGRRINGARLVDSRKAIEMDITRLNTKTWHKRMDDSKHQVGHSDACGDRFLCTATAMRVVEAGETATQGPVPSLDKRHPPRRRLSLHMPNQPFHPHRHLDHDIRLEYPHTCAPGDPSHAPGLLDTKYLWSVSSVVVVQSALTCSCTESATSDIPFAYSRLPTSCCYTHGHSIMAEQTLNVPQLVVFIIVTFLAVRWYLSKPASSGTRPGEQPRTVRINPAQVDQIVSMFPQLQRRDIAWDLQRNGGNVTATTERILNGGRLDPVSLGLCAPVLFVIF
jgi:hypothetical protein